MTDTLRPVPRHSLKQPSTGRTSGALGEGAHGRFRDGGFSRRCRPDRGDPFGVKLGNHSAHHHGDGNQKTVLWSDGGQDSNGSPQRTIFNADFIARQQAFHDAGGHTGVDDKLNRANLLRVNRGRSPGKFDNADDAGRSHNEAINMRVDTTEDIAGKQRNLS